MVSIEAHRAAIGRYYGRFKIREKKLSPDGRYATCFALTVIFLVILCYGLLMITLYAFHTLLPHLMMLSMTYSASVAIIWLMSDTLSLVLQKNIGDTIIPMYKSKDEKTMIFCRNVDTHVFDGRTRKSS